MKFGHACVLMAVMLHVSGEARQQVVNGLNDFTINLYRQVASRQGNVFVAGGSASLAMGMLEVGAQNETLQEIKKALGHDNMTENQILNAYRYLTDEASAVNGNNTLFLANGAFVQKRFNVSTQYKNQLWSFFKAVAKNVDFQNSGQAAKQEINKWVANATKGFIPSMYDSPLHPSTVLVLLNAVAFLGKWQFRFDPSKTVNAPFHYGGSRQTSVNMMQMLQQLRAAEDETLGVSVVELTYTGNKTSMVLLVPWDIQANLASIERQLDATQISRLLAATRVQEVNLTMPRFNIAGNYDLTVALQNLGIQRAFAYNAQLGGISQEASLKVNQVNQKTLVRVNEEGTKAVSATGVSVALQSQSQPLQVNANRPFLFLIGNMRKPMICFMGRVSDPATFQ